MSCWFEFSALGLVTSPPVLQCLPCKMGIIALITSEVSPAGNKHLVKQRLPGEGARGVTCCSLERGSRKAS